MTAVLLFGLSVPATAQSRNLPIVRDAEIEALLYDYAFPLLQAAGVRRQSTDIVLVNQRSFNAFVSGRRIFMNTGAIVEAETPNEIIGVLAHEIGHLAGGHQIRLREQADRAQAIMAATTILGLGAAIAGAKAGNGAIAGAGGGIAAGGAEAAQRTLLSYQRSEELAADRSAVDYLNATSQSARGMLTTFERFEKQLNFDGRDVNPYRISHPLPRERLAALEAVARPSPHFSKTDSAALKRRHNLARAKILAYGYGPEALARAFADDPNGIPARYGKAISTFLNGNPRDAVPMIDRLISEQPQNPYFYEIKGEILMGAQDAAGAVAALGKAVQLAKGNAPTIQTALGHALVLAGGETNLRRAVGELEVAVSLDPANARAYQHLAMAYGRLGMTGDAELATAEANFQTGRFNEAKQFAARAKSRFSTTDPQWLRADDISRFEVPRQRRR